MKIKNWHQFSIFDFKRKLNGRMTHGPCTFLHFIFTKFKNQKSKIKNMTFNYWIKERTKWKASFHFFCLSFQTKIKKAFAISLFYFRTKHAKTKSKIATIFPTSINMKRQDLLLLLVVSKDTNLQETVPWQNYQKSKSYFDYRMQWNSNIEKLTKIPRRGGECKIASGRRGYQEPRWQPQEVGQVKRCLAKA